MHPQLRWIILVATGLIFGGCQSAETRLDDEQETRDRAAIEELHERDRAASLGGDAEALLALWSDDPAALPPKGPILQGKRPLEEMLNRGNEARSVWETIEYEQQFVEVEIVGDYAWDWGAYRGRSRNNETGREVSTSGKLLRILKKAADGSWKVHRSIWNVDPTHGD